MYSSSLFIVPTETLLPSHSSTVLIMPKEVYSSPIVIDQALQCDLGSIETIIPIEIERPTETRDRRSLIQLQMDEKEKQMNRIIGMFNSRANRKELEFFATSRM